MDTINKVLGSITETFAPTPAGGEPAVEQKQEQPEEEEKKKNILSRIIEGVKESILGPGEAQAEDKEETQPGAKSSLRQKEFLPLEPRTPATKKQEVESVMPEISLCAQPCAAAEVCPGAEELICSVACGELREQGALIQSESGRCEPLEISQTGPVVLKCRAEFEPSVVVFSTSKEPEKKVPGELLEEVRSFEKSDLKREEKKQAPESLRKDIRSFDKSNLKREEKKQAPESLRKDIRSFDKSSLKGKQADNVAEKEKSVRKDVLNEVHSFDKGQLKSIQEAAPIADEKLPKNAKKKAIRRHIEEDLEQIEKRKEKDDVPKTNEELAKLVQTVLEKVGDEEKLPTLKESDIRPSVQEPPASSKLPEEPTHVKGQEMRGNAHGQPNAQSSLFQPSRHS
jgi:hypothetical protein